MEGLGLFVSPDAVNLEDILEADSKQYFPSVVILAFESSFHSG
jgi:hypothetical protein